VQDAARIMRDKGIGFLPVCDVDRRVLGTITDRDIVIRCVAGERPITSVAVEDVMTREVVSCGPEDATVDVAHRQEADPLVAHDPRRVLHRVLRAHALDVRLHQLFATHSPPPPGPGVDEARCMPVGSRGRAGRRCLT
jgi:CBS domain-containing protein